MVDSRRSNATRLGDPGEQFDVVSLGHRGQSLREALDQRRPMDGRDNQFRGVAVGGFGAAFLLV